MYFIDVQDPHAARRAGAGRAYDWDTDGRAEVFLLAGPDGRLSRLGYDIDDDQMPESFVELDGIDADRCRHLLIFLDGFAYDVVREFYDGGGLRMCHPPSKVICPYPSMSDMSISDVLGYMPVQGYEATFYDRQAGKVVGGALAYISGFNQPYVGEYHYRADLIMDAIGYLFPTAAFGREINQCKKVFDRRETREVLSYYSSSAGVSTVHGKDGQLTCLRRVDAFIAQLLAETRGLTKVTVVSDHGHTYTPGRLLPLEAHLRERGWRLRDRLDEPNDVVYVRFGLVTYAGLDAQRPGDLAGDVATCPGVDLVSHADGNDVVVLDARGGRARVRRLGDRYAYEPSRGDPLKLAGILATLTPDDRGAYDADELLAATVDHEYPAPLQRLWRAHFALVHHPPDVVASLRNDYYTGTKAFEGAIEMVSTHGSLNRINSTAFIMSTAGALPKVLRSREIPRAMRELLGTSRWPMRE